MKTSYTQLFSYFFIFVSLESILIWSYIPDLPTLFWWIFNTIFIILAIVLMQIYSKNNETSFFLIKLFLFWVFISIIRGAFIAENYWEWKNLFNVGFTFLIPTFVFLFNNEIFLKHILSFWYKYMLLLSIFIIPFISNATLVGQYFSPLLLLLLILPILPFKWKIIVLLIGLSIILFGMESRSGVIKYSVALVLGSFFYIKLFQSEKFIKVVHISIIIMPLLLLFLGLTNVFNIFDMKGNLNEKKATAYSENDLTADTRTFIYVETLNSAIKNNYIIQGRTPARGYDSVSFGNYNKYELGTGKQERFSSEVSILNIFTWYGIIGVFLYFLIFFYSSYLSIYKSNNYYIKVIGLFVAFRWAYSFIEDFATFGIQYIFLWILISMCLSASFRKMSDNEFKNWIRELLNNSSLFKLRK